MNANSSLVTAPPAGNVLTSVFKVLRRRRSPLHQDTNRKEDAGAASPHQDTPEVPDEDDVIMAETKAALKACLVL